MHGKSPLIKNTDSLTKKLKLKYSNKYDFYFAMRYQNPSIDDALEKIYAKFYDFLINFLKSTSKDLSFNTSSE